MSDNVSKLPVRTKDAGKIVAVANPYTGCQHARAIVDPKLAELACADCGVQLNPIQFLVSLANKESLWEERLGSIANARAELAERKRCRCTKCGESRRASKSICSISAAAGVSHDRLTFTPRQPEHRPLFE